MKRGAENAIAMRRSPSIVLLCALALAGCGGGSDSQASPGPHATIGVALGTPAVVALPVYPGATKVPVRPGPAMDVCGHAVDLSMYRVSGASAAAVRAWYAARMKGALPAVRVATGGGEMVMSGDGTHGVTVTGLPRGGAVIVLASYDPGFTRAEMARPGFHAGCPAGR